MDGRHCSRNPIFGTRKDEGTADYLVCGTLSRDFGIAPAPAFFYAEEKRWDPVTYSAVFE